MPTDNDTITGDIYLYEGKQLKKLEKLSNIDIFIHHNGVNYDSQITDEIVQYCKNDVEYTLELFYNRLPFWKLVKLIGFWNAVKHKWRRKNENNN